MGVEVEIEVGANAVDTVTGGRGKVTAIDANRMASVRHPNGTTWRTPASNLRPPTVQEELGLKAAEVTFARRYGVWPD
ncbi:hypothetical protein ABZ442_31590 [Streptomyces triculaminicus]|uniref:hypothetical protein n=1 Tax=Streptomyces triculaminicus TaxID=2816232 RepID=UPI0033F996B8